MKIEIEIDIDPSYAVQYGKLVAGYETHVVSEAEWAECTPEERQTLLDAQTYPRLKHQRVKVADPTWKTIRAAIPQLASQIAAHRTEQAAEEARRATERAAEHRSRIERALEQTTNLGRYLWACDLDIEDDPEITSRGVTFEKALEDAVQLALATADKTIATEMRWTSWLVRARALRADRGQGYRRIVEALDAHPDVIARVAQAREAEDKRREREEEEVRKSEEDFRAKLAAEQAATMVWLASLPKPPPGFDELKRGYDPSGVASETIARTLEHSVEIPHRTIVAIEGSAAHSQRSYERRSRPMASDLVLCGKIREAIGKMGLPLVDQLEDIPDNPAALTLALIGVCRVTIDDPDQGEIKETGVVLVWPRYGNETIFYIHRR